MKNRILLLALIIAFSVACLLSSCGKNDSGNNGADANNEHEHSFVLQVIKSEFLVSYANCVSGSVYYYSCECGEAGKEKFILDDMLDHSWNDATCTEPRICDKCGAEIGSPLGHSFSAPTCTEAAMCMICGIIDANALGHDWIDANCTSPKRCRHCGVYVGNSIGHSWIDADCSHPERCDLCGFERGEKLAHEYESARCIYCGKILGADDGVELPIIPLD